MLDMTQSAKKNVTPRSGVTRKGRSLFGHVGYDTEHLRKRYTATRCNKGTGDRVLIGRDQHSVSCLLSPVFWLLIYWAIS